VVSRNILSRIGPLRVANGCQRENGDGQRQATLEQVLHMTSLAVILSGITLVGNLVRDQRRQEHRLGNHKKKTARTVELFVPGGQ
jgi:hypothetical protein